MENPPLSVGKIFPNRQRLFVFFIKLARGIFFEKILADPPFWVVFITMARQMFPKRMLLTRLQFFLLRNWQKNWDTGGMRRSRKKFSAANCQINVEFLLIHYSSNERLLNALSEKTENAKAYKPASRKAILNTVWSVLSGSSFLTRRYFLLFFQKKILTQTIIQE